MSRGNVWRATQEIFQDKFFQFQQHTVVNIKWENFGSSLGARHTTSRTACNCSLVRTASVSINCVFGLFVYEIYNTKSTTRNWYAHLLRRRVELRGAELGARSPSSSALRGPVRERRGPTRGEATEPPRAELRRGGETRSSRAPDRRRAARCRVGDIRRRHLSDDRAIAEVERGRSETHVCLA